MDKIAEGKISDDWDYDLDDNPIQRVYIGRIIISELFEEYDGKEIEIWVKEKE